jgi:hypothetical protein
VYSKRFKRHKCGELTLDFGDEHDVPHFKEGIMRLRSFALGFSLDIPPYSRRTSSSGAENPRLDDGESSQGYTYKEEMGWE